MCLKALYLGLCSDFSFCEILPNFAQKHDFLKKWQILLRISYEFLKKVKDCLFAGFYKVLQVQGG